MFTSELFSSSVSSGATSRQQLTYVAADAILPQLNNGVQVSPTLFKVALVAGVGAHLVEVQLQAPSQQPFPYINLVPNNRGAAFESPPRVWDFSRAPLEFRPTEELDVFVSQNSGGSETEYVLVNFTDGIANPLPVPINPPGYSINPTTPGRFTTAHWTASTTLTAGAFTSVQPTFDTALPAGTYALIGARAYSATGLFFRMFPAMGPIWRPGGICTQAYDAIDPNGQRYFEGGYPQPGSWGVWMTFFQNVPPKVEFYATSADTAEEGWFDLVFLSPAVTTGI